MSADVRAGHAGIPRTRGTGDRLCADLHRSPVADREGAAIIPASPRTASAATTAIGLLAVLAATASSAAATVPANAAAAVAPAAATTTLVTLRPVADAYVDASRPHRRFGARRRLRADAVRRSYLRFRLGRLHRRVERATLLVHSQGGRGRVRVRSAAARQWRERRLSFARAPRLARAPRAGAVRLARGRWTRLDVTALVRRNVVTLALVPGSRHARLWVSSREARSFAPRLKLVVSRPRSSPSAPGVPGPPGSTGPGAGGATTVTPSPPPVTPSPPPVAPPPPPPQQQPVGYRGRVGVAGNTVWYPDSDQLAYLERARDAGITWIREDFHWGAFERRPGVWDWTIGDRLMRNTARLGIDVLPVVAYSAEWAAAGPTIYHPPRDPNAYGAFCRALVERYGPTGSFWRDNPTLPKRPLTVLEIWNEPWLESFWRPAPDPAGYARLVRAAATAVDAADPTVKILASADIFQMRSDTRESLDWFRVLLRADPELFRTLVDGYSVHPYTQTRSPLDAVTPQRWRFDRVLLTRDLAAAAGASHPIWITEFGWNTSSAYEDSVSEETQARYTREALEVATQQWGGLVPVSFLYYWGKPSSDALGGFSPLRPDGTAKPLWDTLTSLLR